MPDGNTLLVFLTAAAALNITPGPDMLYVMTRSTGEGRAAGIASALGIALGCLFHISALALGLSALLARVPAAYDAVRFVGAAYLVYLGVKALTTRAELVEACLAPARSVSAIVLQGALTNILNPKVALFFLAFIPQFIRADGWPAAWQIIALGLVFNVSGTLVNLMVALGASRATGWLRRNPGTSNWLERATGVIFLGLGVRLALLKRSR
jgi:threonine/homoserine/homoserine lactone efflux protein